MTFTRKEFIGDTKVNVTNEAVDVLQLARDIASKKAVEEDDDSFMIISLDALLDRVKLWKRELPQIEPFYAVKCNSDEAILRALAAFGVRFDCASRAEIDMLMRMGVAPDRIIYANTCKTRGYIAHADAAGVNMMTFDNEEELEKIAQYHKHPRFHVGSGCNDPSAYRAALEHTRDLFELGRALGHNMQIVDVGGGFPGGKHHIPFEQFAALIRSAIVECFPDSSRVRFIAEPGRFFAARPCTLVATVVARTAVTAEKITQNAADADAVGHMYYINDGVYGSFNCKQNDHVHPIGRPLHDKEGPLFPSIILGPTCDSGDKIEANKMMRALAVGECMVYEDMGAYTSAAAATFNGFPRPTTIHVIGQQTWYGIGVEC